MKYPEEKPEVLVRWTCDGPLWRDFCTSESTRYWRGSRAAMHFAIGIGVLGIVVVAAVFVINSLIPRSKFVDAIAPAAVVSALACLAVVIGLLMWFFRRQRDAKLATGSGEVSISTMSASLNGVDFAFFGEYFWFNSCRRVSVGGKTGTKFEIIEFETEIVLPGSKTRTRDTARFRVPVPSRQIFEADQAIGRLYSLIETNRRERQLGK
ncbi:MAG: hypothetical protein ABI999_13665 [Acidobacteriota bacterium]